MRIQKRVWFNDLTPRGYGVAWVDLSRRETVCYPMGLHLVMRWLRHVWFLVADPSEWEWVKRREWEDRLEDMRREELKCTVRTVECVASLNDGLVVVRTPVRMTDSDTSALRRAIFASASSRTYKMSPVIIVPHGVDIEAIPAQHLGRLGLIRIDEASSIVERVIGGRKGARYGIRSTDTTVGAADYGAVEAAGGQN